MTTETTTIIPIAGGKGGVGKSFVTANLAVALAQAGHSTVVVDCDLGNSNLHALLGLENRNAGIGELLRGTVKGGPDELIVPTRVAGLGFIAGDGRMPFMANITYNQKRALLRFVKSISARYVLLDLSAGTSFNTLDFFLTSNSGIVVTTPEYPAVMSVLVFIKNLVLRAIDHGFRSQKGAREKLNDLYKQSVTDPVATIRNLRDELAAIDPKLAERIDDVCGAVRPRVVYNMVESAQDAEMVHRIDHTLEDVLSIECDHFGLIPYDARVREFFKRPGIFSLEFPDSAAARGIARLAHRVIRFWDEPVSGSAGLLENYAREIFPPSETGIPNAAN